MHFMHELRKDTAFFFTLVQQPPVGQGLFITEDSRSHSDTLNKVGLLWTSDQLVTETPTWQYTTLTTDKHPCLLVGFEPTVSASERPQTHTLDSAASGTGIKMFVLEATAPHRARASSITTFLDHTQRRITVGRTPLDEWSARCRDLYLTIHNIPNKHQIAPGGIRTRNPNKRTTADRAATRIGSKILIYMNNCCVDSRYHYL